MREWGLGVDGRVMVRNDLKKVGDSEGRVVVLGVKELEGMWGGVRLWDDMNEGDEVKVLGRMKDDFNEVWILVWGCGSEGK